MDFIQIISNLGFPIASVVALAWFYNVRFKELSENIEQNTAVLIQIREHFRKEDSEKKSDDN